MALEWLIPLLFFPTFVVFWCGIVFLIGATGGWRKLGKRYARDAREFTGHRRVMQSGMMGGLARYNNILTVGADPRGLYLDVFGMFRPGHPPLYIPWEQVEMRERRGWIFTYVDFTFPAVPGVRLTLAKRLAEEVARAGGRPLPVFA